MQASNGCARSTGMWAGWSCASRVRPRPTRWSWSASSRSSRSCSSRRDDPPAPLCHGTPPAARQTCSVQASEQVSCTRAVNLCILGMQLI